MRSQTSARTAEAVLPPAPLPTTATRFSRLALSELGEALGRALTPPHFVALSGDLGAGKTTLIQAICRGYGVRTEVTSPTFALVHVYEGARSPVFHLDLYRLQGAQAELDALGYRDYRGMPGLVIVEWPERGGTALGPVDLRITIEHRPVGRGICINAATEAGRAWQGALRDERI